MAEAGTGPSGSAGPTGGGSGPGGQPAPLPEAPLHAEVAEGPDTGRAVWLAASDGVRLRLAFWPLEGARGTVLLLPGRTEYVEKYGRAAQDLARRGFAMMAVDWRGQGLSDRLGPVRMMGHVADFQHFQRDVDAILGALPRLCGPDLPMPRSLVAHSMAGAIALRALIRGAPQTAGIRGAVFTGPMWDIAFAPTTRPFAGTIARAACLLGLGRRFAPGTSGETYVSKAGFADNSLTTDREMWEYMRRQVTTHPELSLSGPSMRWLDGAIREARAFLTTPLPELPVEVYLGSLENIVSQKAMRDLCMRWPGAALHVLDGKQHEVMMEDPETRAQVFDGIAALSERCADDAPQPASGS